MTLAKIDHCLLLSSALVPMVPYKFGKNSLIWYHELHRCLIRKKAAEEGEPVSLDAFFYIVLENTGTCISSSLTVF